MLTPPQRRFHQFVFAASAVYNLVWGAAVSLFPLAMFRWAGMPDPNYPELWQCIGMFVMTYAIGYAFLAADPERYAPFILIALAGKILGPLGWAWAYSRGRLPGVSGLTIVTNDLIWWMPYGLFVWQIWGRRGRKSTATAT